MSRSRALSAVALAGAAACAGNAPPQATPVPAISPADVAVSLYLIGDAGAPNRGGEPVLQALNRDRGSRTPRSVVLFLGDNIYPKGLPAPGQPNRPEAERRLADQVEAVTSVGGTGYFVPGNHDWAHSGKDGWDAIRRQQAFVDSAGAGTVFLLPGGGCPGPSIVDIGRRLRLVLMDTQWWLHSGPKPRHPGSGCPADSEAEVVDSLRAALAVPPGRLVVVAAHHPLSSGGEHGGSFGLADHLFPLRQVVPWLWFPLPWIGSLYPAARQHGISNQDIPSRAYQRLITAFSRAFTDAPPALYAAGHEHNLQVIAGRSARLQLVSGTGYYGHSGRAVPIRGTLFARNASGFARLDVPHSGPSRLALIQVDGAGHGHEVFSTWVQ
ncbi:MAG TPA: metallophosphoesterase [Gemmatimonadales bacterium]|nr:metallophosphoesterase [Gemmatimonadales bacterium]